MSDQIVVAIISAIGEVITASIPQILTWYAASKSSFPTNTKIPSGNWSGGELLDIQELRILRSLVGEDTGRSMDAYRKNDYYCSFH